MARKRYKPEEIVTKLRQVEGAGPRSAARAARPRRRGDRVMGWMAPLRQRFHYLSSKYTEPQ
jgi:hypothetical protein